MLSRRLTSELQHILAIFMRMLCRNPCACHVTSTLNFQKCSEPAVFNDFDFRIALARRHGANFDFQIARAGVAQILATSTSKSAPSLPVFNDFDFQIAFARRRGANFATS